MCKRTVNVADSLQNTQMTNFLMSYGIISVVDVRTVSVVGVTQDSK